MCPYGNSSHGFLQESLLWINLVKPQFRHGHDSYVQEILPESDINLDKMFTPLGAASPVWHAGYPNRNKYKLESGQGRADTIIRGPGTPSQDTEARGQCRSATVTVTVPGSIS
eukprot:753456-Hanusia_phi.AAC.2